MKHYSIILMLFLLQAGVCHASINEVFENADINSVRADISKYFITRGGQVSHGESYNSNTLQAVEMGYEARNSIIKNFVFNFTPAENGTKVDMTMFKTIVGSSAKPASLIEERSELDNIKASIHGKFLYGLGFDFDMYNAKNGRIKAPKGKETGIKLTLTKYDAMTKGLRAGDVIIEINNIPIKDMPIEEYAQVLFAKSLADKLTLKVKRGEEYITVTLSPRVSTRKVF